MFYCDPVERISIHAAREGGDGNETENFNNTDISIHAAREGGDYMRILIHCTY